MCRVEGLVMTSYGWSGAWVRLGGYQLTKVTFGNAILYGP
jgi:hypothetical protein